MFTWCILNDVRSTYLLKIAKYLCLRHSFLWRTLLETNHLENSLQNSMNFWLRHHLTAFFIATSRFPSQRIKYFWLRLFFTDVSNQVPCALMHLWTRGQIFSDNSMFTKQSWSFSLAHNLNFQIIFSTYKFTS